MSAGMDLIIYYMRCHARLNRIEVCSKAWMNIDEKLHHVDWVGHGIAFLVLTAKLNN